MTDDTDAHTEESIRARSRELLDRTEMTSEELAESEARRKANRLAQIKAPKQEKQLIYRVNEDALVRPEVKARAVKKAPSETELRDRARKAELEAKLPSARWSQAERVEWWGLHALDILATVDDMDKNVTAAIALVIRELAVVAIQQTMNRERLEDRIAALEAGIVAGTRYEGVWQRQQRYRAGTLVRFHDTLFHANTDSLGTEPTTDHKAWSVCARGNDVPRNQRQTAGRRITGNEPPPKPRKIERTVVTAHDQQGRIASFEKEIVEE